MSKKNKEAAIEAFPDSSTTVQAYMASNLELENAMKYLIDELDKAGILEDTVIVLTADHYPYAMSEGSIDYYVELSGIEDTPKSITRYENTLILYCSSMEENVYVDTPCSSIDIVPTLDNLFGIPYDSRLYSGRDIFYNCCLTVLQRQCSTVRNGLLSEQVVCIGWYPCRAGHRCVESVSVVPASV